MSSVIDPFSSVQALSADLNSGRTSASGLVEMYLDRIAALNDTTKAFITVTRETALLEAAETGKRARQTPLSGIPFAAKDLFDVAGVATTAGSKVLSDNIATEDAAAISTLRAAGAISLGKLNLHEFAYGATGENPLYGTCPNPYDPSRLAGGSSSGSAAAVAAGLIPAALGTDTGGSVRAPAALCGLVGLKPTLGRVSTRGVIPYSWTLDHVGTVTRTVADAALLLGTLAGYDPENPSSANEPVDDYVAAADLNEGLNGLTIGVPRAFFFADCDPEILNATERTLSRLEAAGARLVEVTPPSMEHTRTVSLTIQMPEALSYHARYLEARGHLYGDDFRAGLAVGQSILAEHYIRAKRLLTEYRRQMDTLFETVDLLITPAAPTTAPKIGAVSVQCGNQQEPAGNAITRYTSFFNMTGHPAITVPSGLSAAALPLGVQLVARPFEEALLLKAAAKAESRLELPALSPALSAQVRPQQSSVFPDTDPHIASGKRYASPEVLAPTTSVEITGSDAPS